MKRTKIVATIGPASKSEEVLRELIKAGMNVARLNFSHGTHEEHAELIRTIRKISAELDEPVGILQDLQGPKIRVGDLPKEGVTLEKGSKVTFTTGEADVAKMRLPVTYEKLHEDIKPGERILMDDGLLSAKVVSVSGRDVVAEVIDGGKLNSHKGVNFPDSRLTISSITEKDKADLVFGVAQEVDWIALSFVRTAAEIAELRALIADAEKTLPDGRGKGTPIGVIAKIEKGEAVKNIDAIITAVDAIMVARGDMGIEMRAEEVPMVQKMLIVKCRAAAKPVIVATQMLDSMIRNPRATRAEVSDIANAVIDHTDAVMLSGETAGGAYPIEAVKTMATVAMEIEASVLDNLDISHVKGDAASATEAAAEAANLLVRDVAVSIVVVTVPRLEAVRQVCRFRPEVPVIAAAKDGRAVRRLTLTWGAVPFLHDAEARDAVEAGEAGIALAVRKNLAVKGSAAVVVSEGSVDLPSVELRPIL